MLNYVGINNHISIEIANPSMSGLTTSTIFDTQRFKSFAGSYGIITPQHYLKCRVKTTASGSARLELKDYGATTTNNTATSTITASTINLSNQGLSTELSAGPLATTNNNYMMMNFTHGGSGTFSLAGCLFETEADY